MTFYNKFSALGAFALWFTWTYHINAGASNAMSSALFQGCLSASLTLVMIRATKILAYKFHSTRAKIFGPSIIISSLCFSLAYLIHSIIKTSEIFKTVLPAVIAGFLFCIITCSKNIICEEK